MRVLWAPWRMEYILSEQKGEKCIFCPGDDFSLDKKRLILLRGELSMVMMNRYPYINGHLLVAPVRHVNDLESLSVDEMKDLLLTVRNSIRVLKKVMRPEGFNVGLNLGRVAGAGIEEHMHFHIVPRWNGDTNFMTVFGDVRVIPDHIEATYGDLLPHFSKSKEDEGGS